jgi:hypothetical protein
MAANRIPSAVVQNTAPSEQETNLVMAALGRSLPRGFAIAGERPRQIRSSYADSTYGMGSPLLVNKETQ